MLQSHASQLRIKYMTILRRETDLRPEDLGAVRMAVGMALSELQDEHRQQLNEMDDIIADLLVDRDQLKVLLSRDNDEVLRLQTMEDRLIAWVHEHAPDQSDALIQTDTAAVVIDLLSQRGGATAAPPPAPVAVNANGNGNGHVQITDLGTRYAGRRLNIDDEQVRSLAIAKIQLLAMRLGRTPTQKDWNTNLGPDEPSLSSVKNRLSMTWNELVAAAGLTPTLNSHQRAAQIAAEQHEEEAPADNASSNFRSQ